MAEWIKRRPLLHSFSFQLSPEINNKNSRRSSEGQTKDISQNSFLPPKEEKEILPTKNDNDGQSSSQKTSLIKTTKNLGGRTTSVPDIHIHQRLKDAVCKISQDLALQSSFVKAIIDGKLDKVVERIKVGDDIEQIVNGFKPLHYAIHLGRIDIMKQLIKAGCDKTAASVERVTSLHLAVRAGKTDVVALLLEEGVFPDVREKKFGRTPIHEATLLKNISILKAFTSKLQEDPWEARRILKIPDKEGQTALHLAAAEGMTEVINLLLAGGADVAATDNDGATPMHVSLVSHKEKKKCGGVLTQLLEAGGDVEVVGGVNNERLSHFAARAGCITCLDFLFTRGADLLTKDSRGRTPLHVAAMEGKYDSVQFLISKGVDLENQDQQGHRALHLAVLSDNPQIVRVLLKAGGDSQAKDTNGRTYIELAILWRKFDAFQELVRSKSFSLSDEGGEDVIHFCSALGLIDAVSFLLEKGWDINLRDSKGRTALHRSLNHGHEELATMLINADASLQAVDDSGATPLHYAVRWGGSDAILRLLVKKKAKLGVRDRLGRTPLHYAASKFSIMSDLYILLGGGSALDTVDQMGLTPLHLAARLGNESLVRILLESGARHDIADMDTFLPIDHALEKDHKSIVRRLTEHDLKLRPEAQTDHGVSAPRVGPVTGRRANARKSVAW